MQVWIHNISGTVVSRSAMLDALEFKLKIDGQLQAHGGFNFDLGVTTVGLGREPINAWLPLYVNRQHWEKVKVKNKFYIYNIYHITIDFYLFIYLTRITNSQCLQVALLNIYRIYTIMIIVFKLYEITLDVKQNIQDKIMFVLCD